MPNFQFKPPMRMKRLFLTFPIVMNLYRLFAFIVYDLLFGLILSQKGSKLAVFGNKNVSTYEEYVLKLCKKIAGK